MQGLRTEVTKFAITTKRHGEHVKHYAFDMEIFVIGCDGYLKRHLQEYLCDAQYIIHGRICLYHQNSSSRMCRANRASFHPAVE